MRYRKKANKIGRSPFSGKKVKIKRSLVVFFGTTALVASKQQVVEGFVFLKLKLRIKKSIKRKKKQFRIKNARFSYWVRYNPSLFFLKKSKNARMGSGRGKPVRKASVTKANQSLLEFKLFKLKWLLTFRHFLFGKYGLVLSLVTPGRGSAKLSRYL